MTHGQLLPLKVRYLSLSVGLHLDRSLILHVLVVRWALTAVTHTGNLPPAVIELHMKVKPTVVFELDPLHYRNHCCPMVSVGTPGVVFPAFLLLPKEIICPPPDETSPCGLPKIVVLDRYIFAALPLERMPD